MSENNELFTHYVSLQGIVNRVSHWLIENLVSQQKSDLSQIVFEQVKKQYPHHSIELCNNSMVFCTQKGVYINVMLRKNRKKIFYNADIKASIEYVDTFSGNKDDDCLKIQLKIENIYEDKSDE